MSTLTGTEQDRLCCEAVNTYLFEKVWNEPVSEYRQNFKPILVKSKSLTGSFSLNGRTITLPTLNTPYYLWLLDTDTINIEANCQELTWLSLAEINDKYRVLIHIYGDDGAILNKSCTFVMYTRNKEGMLIAARKDMVNKTIPFGAIPNIYITAYYDSDIPNDVEILSFGADAYRRKNEYEKNLLNFIAKATDKNQLLMFKNGTQVNEISSIELGSYYDLILDKNIIFAFDIDVTNTNQDPVYLSKRDSVWKQLIHIPKALNPDNKILTHNTCDFFIRSYEGDKGRYLHRIHPFSVTQVTHNDFGISLDVLDAYRDYLASQLLTIHVVCRQHDKDNVLIRDACYIDLLYSDKHNDKQIIDFLCDRSETKIEWWTAAVTEQSKYVEMMFDTPNGIVATHPDKVMQNYVDGLGIFPIMNVICNRIFDVTITDAFDNRLTFTVPTLYIDKEIDVLVYRNGKLIDSSLYHVERLDDGTAEIIFNNILLFKRGDKLTFIIHLDSANKNKSTAFTPSEDNRTVVIDYKKYTVWHEKEPANKTPASGIVSKYNKVYEPILPGSGIFAEISKDDKNSLIFTDTSDGEHFYIQDIETLFHIRQDISDIMKLGHSITIPLTSPLPGTTENIPIFNFTNLSVYLNGKYLIKGLDYFVNKVTDEDGNFASYEVVIQTMDYFERDTPDTVDIYVYLAQSEDRSYGFAINNKLFDNTPVNQYFENISTLFIDGKLNRNSLYKGVYIEVPKGDCEEGSSWELATAVPKFIRDFIEKYSTNEDVKRINVMNEYFNKLNDTLPNPYVMKTKHRIYSITLNNFINDLLEGKIIATDEPDEDRLKKIFSPYLTLTKLDLVFSGNIDQQFVDFYPQYTDREILPSQRHIIERFVKVFMPANINPTDATVYGD